MTEPFVETKASPKMLLNAWFCPRCQQLTEFEEVIQGGRVHFVCSQRCGTTFQAPRRLEYTKQIHKRNSSSWHKVLATRLGKNPYNTFMPLKQRICHYPGCTVHLSRSAKHGLCQTHCNLLMRKAGVLGLKGAGSIFAEAST